MSVERLVTIYEVQVDCAVSSTWTPYTGGIQDIQASDLGVHINWNFGATFVPWSNVAYILEG